MATKIRDSLAIPDFCPHCKANLIGNEIPKKDQHLFGATHFSRKIGIYDMERDRTVRWQCPDCHQEWPR